MGETELAAGQQALGVGRNTALPEVLANAEKQLAALHAELNQIHEQTAALVKTVDEAATLVKQLQEKKNDDKTPEKK